MKLALVLIQHISKLMVNCCFKVQRKVANIYSFFLEPPKIGPFQFSSKVMNEGDFAQISCILTSGDKPLTINWSFHGDVTGNSDMADGITITNVGGRMSMLVIDQVKHTHQGNYTCNASNKGGSRSHTAQLLVNGI